MGKQSSVQDIAAKLQLSGISATITPSRINLFEMIKTILTKGVQQ